MATQQVLIGGSAVVLSNSAVMYLPIHNSVGPGSTEVAATHVFPCAGIVKRWKIQLDGAPVGSGQYDFYIRKNGADVTGSLITISGTDTEVEDITPTAFAAGDTVAVRAVPSNSPTARKARVTAIFEPTVSANTVILGGMESNKTSIVYGTLSSEGGGGNNSATQNDVRQIFPIPGTLTAWYIQLEGPPGAGDSWTWEIYLNGASTGKTITISGVDDYTGNETTTDIVIAEDDIVTVKETVAGTPGYARKVSWGIIFVPTAEGEWVVFGGSANDLNDTDTEYNFPATGGYDNAWSTSEDLRESYSYPQKVGKLHVLLSAAPGADNSYVFTLRDDNADTSVIVTIADTSTSGNTAIVADISAISSLAIKCVPSGTPDVVDAYYSLACKIAGGGGTTGSGGFRIIYPVSVSSYDYTYLSDKPAVTDHQFREFEWRDQPKIPNIVYVLANQSADGNWDSVVTGGGEQYDNADNNEYPDIVEYYVASTLTTQANADARAAAIALRRWMEAPLGRVIVPHNCGQELYDWIKIRDKREAASYTDYPPNRWGNTAIVGSLTHIYDPANGVYDLEITINGIDSSAPVDATIPIRSIEEEVTELEEISDKTKEIVRKLETGEERMYFPTEVPLTEYGQQRLSEQMGALIEQYGAEGLRERFLKASEEFRQTERWKEEERRWAAGETWGQREEESRAVSGSLSFRGINIEQIMENLRKYGGASNV